MGYIETYNKNILDAVSIGKTTSTFSENLGDYIKVEVLSRDDSPIGTVYSNRLLLKYPGDGSYHIGPYHYHQETDGGMKFCTGKYHVDGVNGSPGSITNLTPVTITNTIIGDDGMDNSTSYQKQFQIFRDDDNRLYIKPNDIISKLKVPKGKYKIRIHFLRNTKSILGNFLTIMESNLIENGNFFAGLEATQTGDIDRSLGKNTFSRISNPGFSPFALEQNGLPNNQYVMKVTGIRPNRNYIFSCWVAWDEQYNGDSHLVDFSEAYKEDLVENELFPESQTPSSELDEVGFNILPKTDLRGSYLETEEDRILDSKNLGGLTWYRLYAFVSTSGNANTNYIFIHLGKHGGDFSPSMNPLGKRFFTDLRFVQIQNFDTPSVTEYTNKLKAEVTISNALKYTDVKSTLATTPPEGPVQEDIIVPQITEESQDIMDTINAFSPSDILSQTFGESLLDEENGGTVPGNNYGDDVGIDELRKGGIIKRKKR